MLLDDIAKIFNQSRGKDRDDLGKADYLSWALHCHRLAFTVLALFVFFTTVHQLSQTPIECNFHSSYPGLSTKYLNARCLVDTMSTSVRLEAEEPGPEITPGIFVAVERRTVTVSHWYYIYVPMLLFAQAALVYAPVFLWRRIHRQRLVPYLIKAKGGKDDSPTGLVGRAKINLDKLAQLLADHRGQQRAYTFWFAACHLLGIAFVVAQFHVASLFFGSMLNEYGLSMLSMKDFVVEGANVTISDAVNHVFPTSTTCHITLFGDGGKGSSLSPLCVLPLNIFNGWLYVVVWVIYVFLIVANILLLLGYSALKLIPALRTALIWFTLPKVCVCEDRRHFYLLTRSSNSLLLGCPLQACDRQPQRHVLLRLVLSDEHPLPVSDGPGQGEARDASHRRDQQ